MVGQVFFLPTPIMLADSIWLNKLLNDQLSLKLKLVGFGFNMNIMLQHPPSRATPYPHVESQTNQIVLHGLSNKQMGIKLQREGSNSGPPAKPSSDTMLNDQLS